MTGTARARARRVATADVDNAGDEAGDDYADLDEQDARAARGGRYTGVTSLVLAVLGLGISIYLTIEHYSASTTLACPESTHVNCAKVTTSAWSHIGPVPVAVLGLVFFVGMTVACLPPLWRLPILDVPRVAAAAVGVLTALYLLWAELFRIGAICLWCTAVHVISLALLAVVAWTTSELRART